MANMIYVAELNIFWAAHQTHHSSEDMHMMLQMRESAFDRNHRAVSIEKGHCRVSYTVIALCTANIGGGRGRRACAVGSLTVHVDIVVAKNCLSKSNNFYRKCHGTLLSFSQTFEFFPPSLHLSCHIFPLLINACPSHFFLRSIVEGFHFSSKEGTAIVVNPYRSSNDLDLEK